eukprot:4579505-Pyramimonas_sp.AAC.1
MRRMPLSCNGIVSLPCAIELSGPRDAGGQLVSPAVTTFYQRLPQDLKAAAKMAHFPPRDLVTVGPRLGRPQYNNSILTAREQHTNSTPTAH